MYRPKRSNPNRKFNQRFPRSYSADAAVAGAIRRSVQAGPQQAAAATLPYKPLHRFEDFPVSRELQNNIRARKYPEPTPIQDQAIPAIMAGRDLVGIANTGTGKTAAFLIPLIDKVFRGRAEKVFIVTPTRELALQIKSELDSFARGLGINGVLCIGGTSTFRQRNEFRRQYNFVIGTPGRIKDMIQSHILNLSQFKTVVLDEADRMVDIGFIEDIKYFLSFFPKERQSLFFSATIPDKVRQILAAFVHDPITISVKHQETAENIGQEIVEVHDRSRKIDLLHDLLIKGGFDKVLVFGRTKHGVQRLADELVKRGFKAGAIHGNKRQSQRQQVLLQFNRGEINILLATDVASRGLDLPDVSHVINYDLPATYDDYIHRIGRTGRANKNGIAITFIE